MRLLKATTSSDSLLAKKQCAICARISDTSLKSEGKKRRTAVRSALSRHMGSAPKTCCLYKRMQWLTSQSGLSEGTECPRPARSLPCTVVASCAQVSSCNSGRRLEREPESKYAEAACELVSIVGVRIAGVRALQHPDCVAGAAGSAVEEGESKGRLASGASPRWCRREAVGLGPRFLGASYSQGTSAETQFKQTAWPSHWVGGQRARFPYWTALPTHLDLATATQLASLRHTQRRHLRYVLGGTDVLWWRQMAMAVIFWGWKHRRSARGRLIPLPSCCPH